MSKQQRKRQMYDSQALGLFNDCLDQLYYDEVIIEGHYWSVLSTNKELLKEHMKGFYEIKRELEGNEWNTK